MRSKYLNYPSRNDLLKEQDNLRVQEFSQGEWFGERDGFGNGICSGLSYSHITRQFRGSFDLASRNSDVIFNESAFIQNGCASEECLTEALQNNLGIRKATHSFRGHRPFFVPTLLKNKIEKTEADDKPRAVLIGFFAKRIPSGEPARGGHMISMTIESTKNGLHCTGLESNTFFATGKGRAGCEALADKMYDTLRSYDAHTAYTYNLSTTITKLE